MQITETQVILVKLEADEGNTFTKKDDNVMLGSVLYLGKNDSISNYTEVPKPIDIEVEE